uniref:Uncharacterized protein n=1 Tax=Caenorhabditis japonica TaxID=281687 RepID=A0A8R1EMW7_CAEJA
MFFIVVGYKFRPANSHNYLLLNSDFDSYDVETCPEEKKKDDDSEPVGEQFLTKAYSEANVSRRVVSDDSSAAAATSDYPHQKIMKKPSQAYEQSLID